MGRESWTKTEDKIMDDMFKASQSVAAIADRLCRTESAVRHRAKYFNGHYASRVSLNDKAGPRLCLRCKNTFNSDGPGNRICHNCTGGNRYDPTIRNCYFT